jgi:release factor glutamine methyltransferase
MNDIDYLKKYLKNGNINDAIKKLETGYPVQYIVGDVNFCGYKILVNENVLIPRFETELLVEKTIEYIKNKFSGNVKILDIGTGSGAIAIALKKAFPKSTVTALDISKEALKIALENAKENEVEIELIHSDLFENINDTYDVIISNPPYIAYEEEIDEKVKKYEPHLALYADDNGTKIYKKILKDIKKYLNDEFLIAFEIGEKQGEILTNYAKKYFDNIIVEKDFPGKDRYLFIKS